MVADIASGHVDAADIVFLIAVILAVIAAVVSYRTTDRPIGAPFGWLAVAALGLGWLLL